MSNLKSGEHHCPLCGSNDWRAILDLCHIKKPLCVPGWIVRCSKCSMWFKIRSDVENNFDAYGEEYSNHESLPAYMASETTYSFFRKALKGIPVKSDKDTCKPPRLLDVGTGLGAMLEVATEMGFEAEGIDLNKKLAEKARERGLKVQCMAVESFDETEAFDVITMLDFIEHVWEPMKVLKSVQHMLKPGGFIVVYTPNHRGAVAEFSKLLKRAGFAGPVSEIFGSNHVVFFDDRTLAFALETAGFEVIRTCFSPYLPLVMRKGMSISLGSSIAVSLIELFGVPLKRVFRMMCYARKAS